MRKVDENPFPAQDPGSTPNRYLKRDATCPIAAEAAHTGGGDKTFKPVGESIPLTPQFPLAEPAP